MVTVHMALALVIVALLLYAVDRARWGSRRHSLEVVKGEDTIIGRPNAAVQGWLWMALLLTFWQIILGTQVRERVDIVSASAGYLGRENWISQLGTLFSIHRTVSAVVVLLNVYVGYELWQLGQAHLRRLVVATMALIGLEVLAGIVLASFALPAVVQPVHLTLATALFGVQFLGLLAVTRAQKSLETIAPTDAVRPVVA